MVRGAKLLACEQIRGQQKREGRHTSIITSRATIKQSFSKVWIPVLYHKTKKKKKISLGNNTAGKDDDYLQNIKTVPQLQVHTKSRQKKNISRQAKLSIRTRFITGAESTMYQVSRKKHPS